MRWQAGTKANPQRTPRQLWESINGPAPRDKTRRASSMSLRGAANRHKRRAEKFARVETVSILLEDPGPAEKANWAANVPPQHKVQTKCAICARQPLTQLRKRHGTAEHIGAISLACNMTGALIRQGIGEASDGDCSSAARRRYSNADRPSLKVAAGDSAGWNCNTFATRSMCTNGISVERPHNSKSAARFGILTNASRGEVL